MAYRGFIKTLLLSTLFLLTQEKISAQIWVEFISRTDSFAFLGSGSDNRVRIHNLPPDAVVDLHPGKVVHVNADEFILCRIDIYLADTAELRVTQKDKIIFSKKYRVFPTWPSGSVYNPILHLTLGHSCPPAANFFEKDMQERSWAERDTILFEDFEAAVRSGFFLSDTSCGVIGFWFWYKNKGADIIGPFPTGGRIRYSCGASYSSSRPTVVEDPQTRIKAKWKQSGSSFTVDAKNIERGSIIILENVTAHCLNFETYEVRSKTFYVK